VPDAIAPSIIRLGVIVALGVVSYVASVAFLWYASDCPDGGERTVLDTVRAGLGARLAVVRTGE